jgi:hypothetical protein
MNDRVIKLLAAIATDSQVLADYQSDPNATMARFGLGEREMKEFINALQEQTSSQCGHNTAVTSGGPVTH